MIPPSQAAITDACRGEQLKRAKLSSNPCAPCAKQCGCSCFTTVGQYLANFYHYHRDKFFGYLNLGQAVLFITVMSLIGSILSICVPLCPELAWVVGGFSNSIVVVSMLGTVGMCCSVVGIVGARDGNYGHAGFIDFFMHYMGARAVILLPIFVADRVALARCEGYSTELTHRMDPNYMLRNIALDGDCSFARDYCLARWILDLAMTLYCIRALNKRAQYIVDNDPGTTRAWFEIGDDVFARLLRVKTAFVVAETAGYNAPLVFCNTMDLKEEWEENHDPHCVYPGMTVTGTVKGNGKWLEVKDKHYLPIKVGDEERLVRKHKAKGIDYGSTGSNYFAGGRRSVSHTVPDVGYTVPDVATAATVITVPPTPAYVGQALPLPPQQSSMAPPGSLTAPTALPGSMTAPPGSLTAPTVTNAGSVTAPAGPPGGGGRQSMLVPVMGLGNPNPFAMPTPSPSSQHLGW